MAFLQKQRNVKPECWVQDLLEHMSMRSKMQRKTMLAVHVRACSTCGSRHTSARAGQNKFI